MNFHDIYMPKFIEVFATGSPEFTSSCIHTLSGREVRNFDREYAKQKYLIKNCRLSATEFEQFDAFFRARRGEGFAFRFRDNLDHKVSGQFVAKGDGKLKQFQLVKLYQDAISPYVRVISKPVKGTVELLLNNNKIEREVNYNTGMVTLQKPLEKNQILTISFLFDVAVRFAKNSFEYLYVSDGSIELSPIELIEVI